MSKLQLAGRFAPHITGAVGIVLAAVYAVEGGYVNNPNDPGGATNHGVTEREARRAGFAGDMRVFPKHCDEKNPVCADEIYFKRFIEEPGLLPVIGISPAVGKELVDSAVNFGPYRPSCWFQQGLNTLNNAGLVEDCKIGPRSVQAFEAFVQRRGAANACAVMLRFLDAKQLAEYDRLVRANSKLRTFSYGWALNRVENVNRELCKTWRS